MLAQVFEETQPSQPDAALWVLSGVGVLMFVVYTASLWRVFTKAGHPGWHSVVPILNTYTLIKVARRPGWWLLLFLVPCVSVVVTIVVFVDLAKEFGKGSAFGIGLVLFPPVFLPILAFGSATYWDEGTDPRFPRPGPYGGQTPPGLVVAGSYVPAATAWSSNGPGVLPPLAQPATGTPAAQPPAAQTQSPGPPPYRGELAAAAAGWYVDPADDSSVRWWDGSGWTGETQQRPAG